MQGEPGWRKLARTILIDVLAVGSVASSGPALSPAEEAEVLDGIEFRLRALLGKSGAHAGDDEVRRAFRQAHPELFAGTMRERHAAARRRHER